MIIAVERYSVLSNSQKVRFATNKFWNCQYFVVSLLVLCQLCSCNAVMTYSVKQISICMFYVILLNKKCTGNVFRSTVSLMASLCSNLTFLLYNLFDSLRQLPIVLQKKWKVSCNYSSLISKYRKFKYIATVVYQLSKSIKITDTKMSHAFSKKLDQGPRHVICLMLFIHHWHPLCVSTLLVIESV